MGVLLLVVLGCTTPTSTTPSQMDLVEPDAASAVQVVPATGYGTVEVPIRLINSYGIAVGSGDLSVTVSGGTAAETELTTDATGHAVLTVSAPAPTRFEVTVTGAASGSGFAYSLDAPPPEIAAPTGAVLPLEAPAAAYAAQGTGGIAFAGSDEVWWQPAELGAQAWRVADLPYDVEGMWGVHIDEDGVLDLAIWSGSQVLLLRGWSGGGYSWGAAWETDAGQIVGVSATDLNSDRLTDVAIGIDGEGEGWVEVLYGNGVWGFEAEEPLELLFQIDSITADDEDRDGYADITLLASVNGTIRRYSRNEDGWAGGSPSQIGSGAYQALDGSTLLPMLDLNGDDYPEVIVEGAAGASSQELVFFNLGTDSIVKYEQSYASFHVTLADMEGNGNTDLLAVEDGTLHLTRYDPSGNSFLAQNFSLPGAAGPVATADINADGLLDLAVLSDQPTWLPGVRTEGDDSGPGSTECEDSLDNDGDGTIDENDAQCSTWRLSEYTWRSFGLLMSGPYLVEDLDGDGDDDILGFTNDGSLELNMWRFSLNDEGQTQLTPGTPVNLGNSTALGLARCNDGIYALTEGNNTVLSYVTIDGAALSQDDWAIVEGSTMDCGEINDSRGAVVATNTGEYTTFNWYLGEADTGFIDAPGGVVLADTDGDGVNEVHGCAGDGCSIVAADFDGDGLEELVRSESAGVTVEGWGELIELGAEGIVSLSDADDDGLMDLLVTSVADGRVMLYSGLEAGLAPSISWQVTQEIATNASLGDANNDGIPELIIPKDDGSILHSEIEASQ